MGFRGKKQFFLINLTFFLEFLESQKDNLICQGNIIYTRMGSKVMPLANFHRNCWREDKTHALYVFSILSPFNRCINCTCRNYISREIYFCTNPTHRRLSKMVGRSVENKIEIRADIKTRALFSRGSTDIYADICTVYVSNSMSFSTVRRQVRDFSAGVGSVTSAPKYCRSKSASSPKIVIKNYIVKSDAKIYFSADCGHGWHFKSICTALLANDFENEEGKHLVGFQIIYSYILFRFKKYQTVRI